MTICKNCGHEVEPTDFGWAHKKRNGMFKECRADIWMPMSKFSMKSHPCTCMHPSPDNKPLVIVKDGLVSMFG